MVFLEWWGLMQVLADLFVWLLYRASFREYVTTADWWMAL
jgi:hypothetical protein